MMMSLSRTATTPSPPKGQVAGLLAVLSEDDPSLKSHALNKLLELVDTSWHEMAQVLPELEALAEEDNNQVAAALASRVLFYLQEPVSALRMAVQFGLPLTDHSPYCVTLTRSALDLYIDLRQKKHQDDTAAESTTTNSAGLTEEQLEPMVVRLLENACQMNKYKEAAGICLESRQVQQLTAILKTAKSDSHHLDLIRYCVAKMKTITSKVFRIAASQVLAELLSGIFAGGNVNVGYDLVLVYQWLNEPDKVAGLLNQLLQSNQELVALQLAFDLQDTGDQAFVKAVADQVESNESMDKVLKGGFVAELSLSFLHKQSKADRGILENLKNKMEERSSGSRSSVLHNAAVVTHSYLYAGTTNDSFLRDHLDWMKKASNWAKFTATASLGVVHASHVTEAMNLLEPYLPPVPSPETTVSPNDGYAEGGSLYALGLIHGSHPASSSEKRLEALEYLRSHLRQSHANEVISHGACLAVGLTAMGNADPTIVNELKDVLDTDSAVAGEAAGMAIGMVLVGVGTASDNDEINAVVEELKGYARETQHEKIIRGISMGLALMQFGQEENADAMIEEMRSDRDPILRYGAQYATALAYAGTGSNKAIRILLHTAVSDVSDDVRMAAVIGLAFVLYQTPERVPELVKLLLESFNPHVRYASCIAVGIAMAGTGNSDSIALLEPMLEDMTDYVRQGALMGTAMIYMQQSDTSNGRKIRPFREKLAKIVAEKHQSTLTKMGAILSTGILDAGGRNCSLQLGSRNGFTKMSSTVGLALWLQHWHWYPMMHMFSLALTPTLTIGLNKDLMYPKSFEIVCNSKPSVFAYPKKLEEKKEKEKKRVETVTLSITAKEKARQARKKAKLGDSATEMEVEDDKKPEDEAMEVDEGKEEEEPETKKKREPEPTTFKVGNPVRITKAQSLVCEFDLSQRYRPVRENEKPFGVIVLTDSKPSETDEDLNVVQPPSLEPEGELSPPEPFDWVPPPLPETKKEDATESDTSKPSDGEDSKPSTD